MTHLTQFWEVVLETEWTLPQSRVVVAHWVSLVKLITLGTLMGETTHSAQDQLT